MPERFTAAEGVEHAEHAAEHASASGDPVIRSVPLIAAMLAVMAGLSSLYSSRLGERMLSYENQAVLFQTRASDAWAEYQADSLKAHLADTIGLTTSDAALKKKLQTDYREYRKRQSPLRLAALDDERKRDDAGEFADRAESRKLVFDSAVALFEIAIVMASVAAMVRRSWLVAVATVLGGAALVIALRGLFM